MPNRLHRIAGRIAVVCFLFSVLLMPSGCASAPPSLAAALDDWMTAVNSRRPEAIAAMYLDDAVLLPTLSRRIRTDAEGRFEYFRKFTGLRDLEGRITETHMRIFDDVASAEGLYTFTYRKAGRQVELPARFSFTFLHQDGAWKIASHHSSPLPE